MRGRQPEFGPAGTKQTGKVAGQSVREVHEAESGLFRFFGMPLGGQSGQNQTFGEPGYGMKMGCAGGGPVGDGRTSLLLKQLKPGSGQSDFSDEENGIPGKGRTAQQGRGSPAENGDAQM